MKWLAMIVMLVLFLVGMMAFFGSNNPAGPGTNGTGGGGTSGADAKGADGKAILRFSNSSKHVSLDPQTSTWGYDLRLVECLYERLVSRELPSMKIVPGVAERWEMSPDGKTFTFNLRPNAKWSDGTQVTADDFVFAWRRLMLPDLACEYANLSFLIDGAEDFYNTRREALTAYRAGKDKTPKAAADLWEKTLKAYDKVGLNAKDPVTFVVRLRQPTPYFLELANFAVFAPVHKPSVLKGLSGPSAETGDVSQDVKWNEPGKHHTNGAYIHVEDKPGVIERLRPNPHYWNKAAVANGGVDEVFIENPQTQVTAYEKGEIDWLPELPTSSEIANDLVRQARAKTRNDVRTCPAAGTYFYRFNTTPTLPDGRRNPFADQRVRRAFSMAVDRKTLVEQIIRVGPPVAHTFVPPGVVRDYVPPKEAGVEYNPAEAKKLLAEAGFPDGKGLEGLELLYNTGGGHDKAAEFIRKNWESALGVRLSTAALEVKAMQERINKQSFAVVRSGWYGDYADPITWLQCLVTDDGQNDGKYSNPKYDELLTKAAGEADAVKRFDLLKQAEAMMLADQPIIPLYHYIHLELWRPDQVLNHHLTGWHHYRLELVKVKR